jgi:predicted outer membrane repeat protein
MGTWILHRRVGVGARPRSRRGVSHVAEGLEARTLLSTYTVTTLAASGLGSLTQAVADANASPGEDTVDFGPGLRGTITLTDGEIVVTDSTQIRGPGSERITIAGNNQSRLFWMKASVVISRLTMADGRADGAAQQGYGGAIYSEDGLVVEDCVFNENSAAQRGGAIWAGWPVVRGSTFTRNQAPSGGAIAAGEAVIESSILSGNRASQQGGAVWTMGVLTIRDSTVSENTGGEGGGVRVNHIRVEDSTFSGNSGSTGGGISAWGDAVILRATFYGNHSSAGGGVFADGELRIENSTITGNTSDYDGGGLHTYQGEIVSTTIAGNTAGRRGGGIFIRRQVSLSSVLIANSSDESGPNDIVHLSDMSVLHATASLIEYPAPGSLNGTNVGNIIGRDPALGSLSHNGGPTRTLPLLPGSPAIDAGSNNDDLATDQRGEGFMRARGLTPDIGAYESSYSDPTPKVLSPGTGSTPGAALAELTPTLMWRPGGPADEYGIYVSRRQPNGTYALIFNSQTPGISVPGDATSFTLPAGVLQEGQSYRWNMNARTGSVWGAYAPRSYFRVSNVTRPNAPTELIASASGPRSVSLNWADTPNATLYKLYRAISASGPWTLLNAIRASAYEDAGGSLQPGASYVYRVLAWNDGGDSASSDSAAVRTPTQEVPPSPSGLEVTSTTSDYIGLVWNQVATADSYIIERSTTPGAGFMPLTDFDGDSTAFADRSLVAQSAPTTTLYYRVLSVRDGIRSQPSAVVPVNRRVQSRETPAMSVAIPVATPSPYAAIAKIYRWRWQDPDMGDNSVALWDELDDSELGHIDWTHETTILTHGWNDSLNTSGTDDFINEFARNFMSGREDEATRYNILAVDWYANGSKHGSNPRQTGRSEDAFADMLAAGLQEAQETATNAVMVAKPLAVRLATAGIKPGSVTLIGHSNGAGFMASLALTLRARLSENVYQLVALDAPAQTIAHKQVQQAAKYAVDYVENYYVPVVQTTQALVWGLVLRGDVYWYSDVLSLGFGLPMLDSYNIVNFELNAHLTGNGAGYAHNDVAHRYARTAQVIGNSSSSTASTHWGFGAPVRVEGIHIELAEGDFLQLPVELQSIRKALQQAASNAVSVAAHTLSYFGLVWIAGKTAVAESMMVLRFGADAAITITRETVNVAQILSRTFIVTAYAVWETAVGQLQSARAVRHDLLAGPGPLIFDYGQSPAYSALEVQIPADAALLRFDLSVVDEGNLDELHVRIDGEVIGVVDLATHLHAPAPIELSLAAYAGRRATLEFLMPSLAASDAKYFISNPQFLTNIAADAAVIGRSVFAAGRRARSNAEGLGGAVPISGKSGLLPGQTASSSNYTTHAAGIGGVIVDLMGLPADIALTSEDFDLRVGDGVSWSAAPIVASVSVARGTGIGGSDRITVSLQGSPVRNRWMRVLVKANPRTGLTTSDSFYFGNLVGDVYRNGAAVVDGIDVLAARERLRATDADSVGRYDLNGDGIVNTVDLAIVRSNLAGRLAMFTAPPVGAAEPAAEGTASAPLRDRIPLRRSHLGLLEEPPAVLR